jgi:CheY-like chemotaxis protein
MSAEHLNILLADDDTDDCLFFEEALDELKLPMHFTAVHDGEKLMQLLENEAGLLPHIVFLDLNMPRKNGFECLLEIKASQRLRHLPVIIFSTSLEQEVVNRLYDNEAQYFIRKPADFAQFKKIIRQTFITIIVPQNISQPDREDFVLTLQTVSI